MTNWSSNFVETNGIRLHYHRSGDDKPPLVMCHGITDSGLCWTRLAQVLQADYDLLMPDARGHGLSEAPENGYSAEDHAADIAGLIRGLNLGKPAVLGHSMGARTAAVLGAKYPELPACLILEDPSWRHDTGRSLEEQRAGLEAWRASVLRQKTWSIEEIVAEGQKHISGWDAVEFGPWAEAKQRVSPNVFNFSGPPRPWEETVPNLKCPTLLVTGDPDLGAIVTPEIAQQVTETNALIQVVHLPGAGHNIRREQFAPFVDAVTQFLRQVYG